MALAIFDLDNTLIAGDSDHSWGEFLVQQKVVDVDAYQKQNDQFYQDYCAGSLDMNRYLQFSLQPLSQIAPETLQQLQQQFMAEVIRPLYLPKAEQLLEKHRSKGDFLLVITSTNRFIVEPICNELEVDGLIATEPEILNGQYTGNFSGTPSFGEGKITRLNSWLNNKPFTLEDSFFYSDSINDLPLLLKVPHPVAVDPDDALRLEASNRGWETISLRG